MDRITAVLVEGLKQALADPDGRRLYKSGKLDGLFVGRSGAAGEAAARALRDGLVEVVRTETRGKTVIDWVRLTPAGVEFLHRQESPARALDELRTTLHLNQQALPAWLAEMRASLAALDQRLADDARRWHDRLEALARRVEETLHRIEQATPPLPADLIQDYPWAIDAVNYLDRRKVGGASGDCPLPELFAALVRGHAGLSVGTFHEGLKRLHQRHALRLRAADAPPEMAQPEFALFDGDAVLYYAARRVCRAGGGQLRPRRYSNRGAAAEGSGRAPAVTTKETRMPHLTRRQLLRSAGAGAAALALAPLAALARDDKANGFTLPPLPYPYDALEPSIDKMTMEIHHDKHHKAYVDNLNKALAGHADLLAKSITDILKNIDGVPENIRQAVINNGGGHANHSMFWEVMCPPDKSGEPSGDLAEAIKSTFGGLDKLQQMINDAGLKRFGSGWSWLVLKDGKLDVHSSANQDSPLMKGQTPILGVDVWEHAYYLKYQNRRGDYLKAWWKVVNWKDVGARFDKARA
jgi:Fe-Mn family superoxide dismutase